MCMDMLKQLAQFCNKKERQWRIHPGKMRSQLSREPRQLEITHESIGKPLLSSSNFFIQIGGQVNSLD